MVALSAALLVAGFVWMLRIDQVHGTLRAFVIRDTIAAFLISFAGYLGLMVLQRRNSVSPWNWLLVLGLGLRLALVFTEPTLSDDVYRYLWEGHLVTEGVSPYAFTIDDPAGDLYNIGARELANNSSLASPYLPVAHALFGATALVLPSEPWSMQLLMIGFDALAATMIVKLLVLAKLPPKRVLLYWLNPLVIVEVAHGAHIDALIVGLASAGLFWTLDFERRHGRSWAPSSLALYGGPAMIAIATLTRPLAILFVPVLFWLWNWRQRWTWVLTLALPILVTGAISGFGLAQDASGTGVFGSARAYTETFRFNSGIYHWLETWVGGRGLDDKGWNEPGALTRLIIAVVVSTMLLGVFAAARHPRSTRSTLRLLAVPVATYVVLTPVLHPWYTLLLLSLVPFLAPGVDEPAIDWIRVAPWLVLSGLLIFSYLTYEDPQAFGEREWVRRMQWYPLLLLLTAAFLCQSPVRRLFVREDTVERETMPT